MTLIPRGIPADRRREEAELREAAQLEQRQAREAAKRRAAAVKALEQHGGFACHAPGYPTEHCYCACHSLETEEA